MPKLWVNTIDAHRREVRRAILETTAALVAEHGVPAVTMSQIAEATGIGRATLYKYFPDVQAILDAWHEDHVARHLERLAEVRDRHRRPGERLAAVLAAYAEIVQRGTNGQEHMHPHPPQARHAHPASAHDLGAGHIRHMDNIRRLVHRSGHIEGAQRRLAQFFQELLRAAIKAGDVRTDIAPAELATFCIHALAGASALRSRTEIVRLVDLTLSALRAPKPRGR